MIRLRGYEIRAGLGSGEHESALGGIAVPVFDERETVAAVLGVTAAYSLDGPKLDRAVAELLTVAARASEDLGNRSTSLS